MEAAGLAVADEAARLARSRGRIVVLCGPGQQRRRRLCRGPAPGGRGFPVELGLLGAREALRGDAAVAAARYPGEAAPPRTVALDGAD